MHNAIRTLQVPFTYGIGEVSYTQRTSREQISKLAIEGITLTRDTIMKEAVTSYLRSRGLTVQQIESIFHQENGQS